MGLEILAADPISVPVNDAKENSFISDADKSVISVQGKLEDPIKFGLMDSSEDINEETKTNVDPVNVMDANFPKDAVDEWPEPHKIHTFYFVKYQPLEDPKLKAKLEQVDKEIQKQSKERFRITDALKSKRSERSNIISQLKPLTAEDKQFREAIDGKRKEMEPLHAALGKLRNVNNAEKGMGLCSSEEELDHLIQTIHYRIQHESNTLAEEKQLLKDIKQLEGTRQKVIVNASMRAKLQESLGPKEAIQDQVKLIGVDLDGVRKEQQTVRAKIRNLEEELKMIDDEISSLQVELDNVTQKKDKAYETLNELRKTRDGGNSSYYQYRSLLNNVRELAAKKDIAALEQLSHDEVEKFMSQWSGDKAFRDDYKKRILSSLDRRQLSKDGKIRNPDEKPIIEEVVTHVELEAPAAKVHVNHAPAQHTPSQKAHKDDAKKSPGKETKENSLSEDPESAIPSERKEASKAPEFDAAKLKEMKREEEINKAKLALERKKKQAEKASAKAAAWAQKEAERKLKDREKKAKKKTGASGLDNSEEQAEADIKAEESLTETEEVNEPQILPKVKVKKEGISRRTRSKGRDQLPKLILKKKKSQAHLLLWAVPAVLAVLALVIAGYYYLGRRM